MSGVAPGRADVADALRRAFDQSFADAVHLDRPALDDLLAIRIADEAYALRRSEVAGIFADVAITPLPSAVPELLGIVGMRRIMLPVYGLGAVLGVSCSAAPRWIVVAAERALGLAFDEFGGLLRLPCDAVAPEVGSAASHRYVREIAHTADGLRPVIHLPSVVAAIAQRAGRGS